MKKWYFTSRMAVLAGCIFVVGLIFSGGGHGWGTDLVRYTFFSIALPLEYLDQALRCKHTANCPPDFFPFEVMMLFLYLVGAMIQFAVIGLVVDAVRRKK